MDALGKRAQASHRCYDNALARDATLRGKVTVTLTVGSDGRVCEARAESEDKTMEAVASCVTGYYAKDAGGSHFPPPDDGCVVIKQPINFVPRPASP